MPKYQMYYQWTCPQCGHYNSAGYHCTRCFYAPKVPKQRLSVVAVALAVGCVLLGVLGAWLVYAGFTVFGVGLVVVGVLMGWGAAKW
jgi:hypothetical protein